MSIKLIITGSKGRMGHALESCAARHGDVEIVGRVDMGDDLGAVIGDGDVVIDFSLHDATLPVARVCAARGTALVIGTTGQSEAERKLIRALADKIPMVWASNFSTGVNVLFWLTRRAAEILGPVCDLEIVEMHHRMKQDAPSGTARTLAEILAAVRGRQMGEVVRHGRQGICGERGADEIGVHSLRGGDVVGDHTVTFAGVGERLELTHRASSRETFAAGALRAATWVVGRDPGLYDMEDVLGLR
jgi:4-hydroxy-tetrahydrodipicolinate reductase